MDIATSMRAELPKFKGLEAPKEIAVRNHMIYLAHDFGSMTQAEIARLLGLSAGHVWALVRQARWPVYAEDIDITPVWARKSRKSND